MRLPVDVVWPYYYRFQEAIEKAYQNLGIVNLTRVWETGPHEKANTQLPTPLFFSEIISHAV